MIIDKVENFSLIKKKREVSKQLKSMKRKAASRMRSYMSSLKEDSTPPKSSLH